MTNEILVDILIAIISICLSGLIISNPFLGVVFIAASLPVAELLPSVRYLSSILPVIGAVAILGYLLQNRKARRKVIKGARPVLIVASEGDANNPADSITLDSMAAGDHQLIILPDAGHGTDMLEAAPDLAERIVAWLVARVPPPGQPLP
mgnify:CR=1 FL=1